MTNRFYFKKYIIWLIPIAFLIVLTCYQNNVQNKTIYKCQLKKQQKAIPFILANYKINISLNINDSLNIIGILDNGTPNNFIDLNIVKKNKLNLMDTIKIPTVNFNYKNNILGIIKDLKYTFSNTILFKKNAYMINLSRNNYSYNAILSPQKFGKNILIDFATNQIIFDVDTNNIKEINYKINKLLPSENQLFFYNNYVDTFVNYTNVPLNCNFKYKNNILLNGNKIFKVDLGFSSTIMLNINNASVREMINKNKSIFHKVERNLHGRKEEVDDKYILVADEVLLFDNIPLKNVYINFVYDNDTKICGYIGVELLKKYICLLDFSNQKIYTKKIDSINTFEPSRLLGFNISRDTNYTVELINRNAPYPLSDIRPGDRLIELNGLTIKECMKNNELIWRQLNSKIGVKINVKFKCNNKIIQKQYTTINFYSN